MSYGLSDLVDKKMAADLLGIKTSTVGTWLRKGYLERVIRGNKWYISLRSVRECHSDSRMYMRLGPFYEANRAIVESWVESGGKSAGRFGRKRVSVDAESFDD